MEWLQNNWIWLAAAGGFAVFHFFGHGGHGHGSHNQGDDGREADARGKAGARLADREALGEAGGHGHAAVPATARAKQRRHGC